MALSNDEPTMDSAAFDAWAEEVRSLPSNATR